MGLFKLLSNYYNGMDQSSHNKLMAASGSLFTIYSLYKIDLKIRTSLAYLLNSFLILFLTSVFIACILYKEKLMEYFKNINYRKLRLFLIQHGLLVFIFVLILFGFFYLKEQKRLSNDLRNRPNLFRFLDTQSNEDGRIYLDENYTELTSQFNENLQSIIKSLNKKLTQRVKLIKLILKNESLSNETTNLDTNQNYIDLEFLHLFNYLNKTLPLFLQNQTYNPEQIDDNNTESLIDTITSYIIKLIYVMLFASVTSFVTLKLLHRNEVYQSGVIIGKKLASPSSSPTIVKDNSCQTQFEISNKDTSRSSLEINKSDSNRSSKTPSVLMITEQQEEEFLKYKILKELSDDATSHLLNWILFLGLDNFLNDTKTNVASELGLDQTKLFNQLIQNVKSTKQQLKFDDIYIKNVDTLPPKFTNIQTVLNAVDNLTLRANVEFNNIDMKVEFKKSKRLLDIKMTSAKAQLMIVLSQNKNHVFSLECSLDQHSDLAMTFEKNQNIEPDIMQYFETLLQTAAKQTVLNLELNSINKSVPNFGMPAKSVKTANKPMAPQPQTNSSFSAPTPSNTTSSAAGQIHSLAQAPVQALTPTQNTNTAVTTPTSSQAKAAYNTLDVPNYLNSARQVSSTPSPSAPLSRNDLINNLLINNNAANNNNNLNTNLNTNSEFNETLNLNEANVQVRPYEDEEFQLQYQQQQQQQQQKNENAFENEVNNIQALAAAAAAANAKQLRNSVNEKRLLVKLLKATNLTNCEEPYIVVELDYPMQKHITDIHRDMSSINEQFFFDIIANSEELTFSIFDRAKDYGNDLVGEAVIPVNDLCSSLSAKRVIQLHRYGQTKTGSITAEFVFIEPSVHSDQNEPRLINRATGPTRNRNSVSPFDHFRTNASPEKRMLYRDELLMPQQTNPEQLSDSEYPSPRSPLYNENEYNIQMDALYNNQMMQQQHRSRQEQQMVPQGRVINRNYLQTQAHNRAKTLDPRGSNDYANMKDQLIAGGTNDIPLNTLDKRKRSISRSLKSLLNKSTSKIFGNKRDKSNDVQNTESQAYDTQSVDNNKKVGNSIKKLFEGKKNTNTDTVFNQNPPRPNTNSGPAISISRPDESMLLNNQIQFYPNNTNEYYMQQPNMNINSQIDNSNSFKNNLTEDIYSNTPPVLLRRRYRSP